MTMNPEARTRLDAHLDAVEAALASAGHSREQRRAILDDLEAQIRDMLAARSASPQLADVQAILAQLDRPEAYAGASAERKEAPQQEPVAAPAPRLPPIQELTASASTATKRRKLMKPSVLVALIVCGTALVMTPAVIDIQHQRNFLEYSRIVLSNPVPDSVRLSFDLTPMDGVYRFGFWLTGTAAILCGVIGGFVAFARDLRRPSRD